MIDSVRIWSRSARARLRVRLHKRLPLASSNHHVALRTVKDISHSDGLFIVRGQSAHFKLKYGAVIVKNGMLSVRRFAIVFVAESAAVRKDRVGQAHTEPPASDVHFVHALIANVTVSIVPLPVPIIVELLATNWLHWCRPAP